MASVVPLNESKLASKEESAGGGAQRSAQEGQNFQPMEKAASQTVKLNPKLELSHTELLKLLSYMEAELQARDVVIATLKTERIKSLLAYGRGGVHDPVLALQRDTGNAAIQAGSGGENQKNTAGRSDPQLQMRGLQDTQLNQLEHLISQQRKAHQRMRHVLREAEKRHSRVVGELEEERRKHEHDTAQGDDVTYALEKDRSRLKQSIDSERNLRCSAEAEVNRLSTEREDQHSKHKQIVLLLLEDRNRLAAQANHYKLKAEELAKLVSEEKGRMDGMAEGLEEESKKSLQMEAELEKQLAQFDTERQQMRVMIQRRDDRIEELELQVDKLQRDVSHYHKQLQEAHNVAMFQQTLSVSPPRMGSSTLPPSTLPSANPQNIVSIPSLSPPVSTAGSLGSPVSVSNVRLAGSTGAVSKTSTLPAGSTCRPQPPQLPAKPPQLTHSQTRLTGTLPPPKGRALPPEETSHHLCSLTESKSVQLTATVNSVPVTLPTTGIARGVASHRQAVTHSSGGESCEMQLSSRVNVSASGTGKLISSSQGGKFTFQVSPSSPSSIQSNTTSGSGSTVRTKPLPPARSSTTTSSSSSTPPPLPPNKPLLPSSKKEAAPPISLELKPHKLGPQTLKFGITISKSGGGVTSTTGGSEESGGSAAMDGRMDVTQVTQTS